MRECLSNPDVLPEADPYKSRRFKYKELQVITNDWRNVIGEGGFGHVYAGQLEDGTDAAVKVESQTSLRGNHKQFLAEVCTKTPIVVQFDACMA